MGNIITHIKFPNEGQEREVVDKAGRELTNVEIANVRTDVQSAIDASSKANAEIAVVDSRLIKIENDKTGNLLKGVGVTNNMYIDDSGIERSANLFFTTDYIQVKGGAAVHLAGTIGTVTNSHRRLHAYNASRGWIEQTIDINVAGTPSYDDNAVLPINAAFVRFCYRSGDTAMSLTTSVLVDKGARIELANHEGRIKTLENGGGGGTGLVLDPTLTDHNKAAPANLVGALKDDIEDLQRELTGVSALADSIGEVVG